MVQSAENNETITKTRNVRYKIRVFMVIDLCGLYTRARRTQGKPFVSFVPLWFHINQEL